MQIVYHLGAHVTDEGRLLTCLQQNANSLAEQGIAAPPPEVFRPPIGEALRRLHAGPVGDAAQADLLSGVLAGIPASRVVLSVDSFLGAAGEVLGEVTLYPDGAERITMLRDILPDHEVEFFFGVRNPATFLPALSARVRDRGFDEFIAATDPAALRWSETVGRLAAAVPDCSFCVWANEDTPVIWPELLWRMARHDPDQILDGVNRFLSELISRPGMKRLARYMETHPPANEFQRRQIVHAFMERYGREDEIEMDLGMTGWSSSFVQALTEIYEEDLEAIAAMPGITFLPP